MKKQRRDGGGAPPTADAPAPAVHDDPRFAAVHSNPRFARFPKARLSGSVEARRASAADATRAQAKSKVEIDQRFSGVFSDPKFKRQTVVDKRGRATGAKCVMAVTAAACCKRSRAAWRLRECTDDLRRFYRLPDEEAAGAEARAVAAPARLVCSSRRPIPPQDAAPQEDDDDDDASASDLSDEEGAAPAFGREGARRGIRGSVSVSSSSSDEGAAEARVWHLRAWSYY